MTQYQLLWAGPWYRDRMPPGTMQPSVTEAGDSTSRARALANGRSIYYSGKDLRGVRIRSSDPQRVYQSCAVCHQPTGAGGVRLADGAISAALGPQAHMRDSMGTETSSNTMPGMSAAQPSWTLDEYERAISQGVDTMGMTLSPVMPRWKMSKRDLHDIALYVLTQLHP